MLTNEAQVTAESFCHSAFNKMVTSSGAGRSSELRYPTQTGSSSTKARPSLRASLVISGIVCCRRAYSGCSSSSGKLVTGVRARSGAPTRKRSMTRGSVEGLLEAVAGAGLILRRRMSPVDNVVGEVKRGTELADSKGFEFPEPDMMTLRNCLQWRFDGISGEVFMGRYV